ncbi:MAG: hypothetical protein GY868_02065 [Deltaproteobacteria bacterium]|nr:hypothetical protein [Deltaproteobacteria bacterium]
MSSKTFSIIREYYPNGALKAERRYKNGILHGLSRFYTENGNLWATQNSADGVTQGMHFIFHHPPNSNWPF